ncbi:MAG TPA: VacJ family lipoprotein, partial [Roseomonas sp.]
MLGAMCPFRPPSPRPLAARLLGATLALGLLGGTLSGCATRPPADDPEALEEFRATNDPIEPWNRATYDVHQAIDTVVLRPVAV